jgi:hypothetical protein
MRTFPNFLCSYRSGRVENWTQFFKSKPPVVTVHCMRRFTVTQRLQFRQAAVCESVKFTVSHAGRWLTGHGSQCVCVCVCVSHGQHDKKAQCMPYASRNEIQFPCLRKQHYRLVFALVTGKIVYCDVVTEHVNTSDVNSRLQNVNRNNVVLLLCMLHWKGARGGAVRWGTTSQDGRSRFRSPSGSLKISRGLIFLSAFSSPGVHSTSNRA